MARSPSFQDPPAEGPGYTLHAAEPDPLDRAAALLAEIARPALESAAGLRFAIPGGSALSAATRLADLLGSRWAQVKLTWVDERCVAPDDSESNQGAAFASELPQTETLLPLFMKGEQPEDAVLRVTQGLAESFGGALDLTLLGMGEDGHVASLFPSLFPSTGSEMGSGDGVDAPPTDSEASSRPWVAHIEDSPKPPSNRITLTRPFLATARRTVLVALGEGKREALLRLLAGDTSLPATHLPDLHIVTDLHIHSPAPSSPSTPDGCA